MCEHQKLVGERARVCRAMLEKKIACNYHLDN